MIKPIHHQGKWIDACKASFNSPEHKTLTSSFDYAGPMTKAQLLGNVAIRSHILRRENEKGKREFFVLKNYSGMARKCALPIWKKPINF